MERPGDSVRSIGEGAGVHEAEDAAWAWMRDANLLDALDSKQVELEVADLVVGAFLLYALKGPRGPIREWRRPYMKVGDRFAFETDRKDMQTPWGVLLREAVRLVREHRRNTDSPS